MLLLVHFYKPVELNYSYATFILDIFLVWGFFLKKKSIMDFHVIVQLIYRVDFFEINSCLAVTTLLFPKLISTKLVHAKGFSIKYLLLNMTVFLLNSFILKAVPLLSKISYPSPNVNCLFGCCRSPALFFVGSVSWRGQTFLLLSGSTKLQSALVVLLMAQCFHVVDGWVLARKIQDDDGSVSHSYEW